MKAKCKRCKQIKNIHSKGMCLSCYNTLKNKVYRLKKQKDYNKKLKELDDFSIKLSNITLSTKIKVDKLLEEIKNKKEGGLDGANTKL